MVLVQGRTRRDEEVAPKSTVVDGEKKCTSCEMRLPLSSFYLCLDKNGRRYPNSKCKSCASTATMKSRGKLSRQDARIRARSGNLWTFFRMRTSDYETLLEAQDQSCAICKRPIRDSGYVDHDHQCCPGKRSCGQCVRGILCRSCNTGLGCFQDDVDVMARAIVYLGG